MADIQPMDWDKIGKEIGREFGRAFGGLTMTLTAQGALSFLLHGHDDRAAEALTKLTADQRSTIADAAERLAALVRRS